MPSVEDLPYWRPPTPGIMRPPPPPNPPPEPVFVPNLGLPMMGGTCTESSKRGSQPRPVKPSRTVQGDYDMADFAQHRWELTEPPPSSATLVNSRAAANAIAPKQGALSSIGGIANSIFNASAELIQKQLIDSSEDDSDSESYSVSRAPLQSAHGRGTFAPIPTRDVQGPSPPLTFSQTYSDVEPRGTSPHVLAAVGADAARHRYVGYRMCIVGLKAPFLFSPFLFSHSSFPHSSI